MQFRLVTIGLCLICAASVLGCRSSPHKFASEYSPSINSTSSSKLAADVLPAAYNSKETVKLDSGDKTDDELPPPIPEAAEKSAELVAPPVQVAPSVENVVESVRSHFPLILYAAEGRRIAAGQALSASGAFDHKLDAFSESQPLDFYENYRQGVSIKRNTTWGGQTFAGYRVGRGFFEPWYLERETNKGGEFKAGFIAPLIRDRWIDANRAELWQAQLERRRVEPEILAAVIQYVRDGSVAYWQWIAAGSNRNIAVGQLELAQQRNEALSAQVAAEEKAAIDLVDNRRIIVSRESKLIDAQRKLEQATVKLSLFYRTFDGQPLLVGLPELPKGFFAEMLYADDPDQLELVTDDEQLALAKRPELRELQIVRQQLCVALRQAKNETWPDVDGGLLVAQDVGEPTSSKRDKSEFEVEALLTVSVPLERRKAFGKIRSLRGKLAQLTAKNRFASDKISAEVRLARAALEAARQRVAKARESFDLALQMQEAEQEIFNQGQSTLFNLNIREKQAAEAATDRVAAQLEYHIAKAEYAAAMGFDSPEF